MLNYFNKPYLGENYVFLDQSNDNLIPGYVADIKAKLPNGGVIFNTLNGGSNIGKLTSWIDTRINAFL